MEANGVGSAGARAGVVHGSVNHVNNLQSKLKVNKLLIHPGEINSFKCWQ